MNQIGFFLSGMAGAGQSPEILITQSDNAVLTLFAQDQDGNPVNLTAATFSTQILGPNGDGPVTIGNSQHTIVSATNGEFTITLTPVLSESLGIGSNKSILTQITQSGNQSSFWGNGILTVLAAVPEQ